MAHAGHRRQRLTPPRLALMKHKKITTSPFQSPRRWRRRLRRLELTGKREKRQPVGNNGGKNL